MAPLRFRNETYATSTTPSEIVRQETSKASVARPGFCHRGKPTTFRKPCVGKPRIHKKEKGKAWPLPPPKRQVTEEQANKWRIRLLQAQVDQIVEERDQHCKFWWRHIDDTAPDDDHLIAAVDEQLWLKEYKADWFRRATFLNMIDFVTAEEANYQLWTGEIARLRAEKDQLSERVEEQRALLGGFPEPEECRPAFLARVKKTVMTYLGYP